MFSFCLLVKMFGLHMWLFILLEPKLFTIIASIFRIN